jgi:hypothetical protein
MTKNTCSAVFALLVSLSLTSPAGAAGRIESIGFYCTNSPLTGAWFHSTPKAHLPQPPMQSP